MTIIDRATQADIAALMDVERGEGFEELVGRWSASQHAVEMASAGSRYLAARNGSAVEGFALLQALDDPHGCVLLRRIAVARPGEGLGRLLLDTALAHAFAETEAHRVQLRVYPENGRARRAYARVGFIAEGLLRDVSRRPDGTYRSMLMMSVLRPEWERRAAGP